MYATVEAACENCGRSIIPTKPWHRLCSRCWRTRNEPNDDPFAAGYHVGYDDGFREGYKVGRFARDR